MARWDEGFHVDEKSAIDFHVGEGLAKNHGQRSGRCSKATPANEPLRGEKAEELRASARTIL
jgi:hypothetical protein